MKKIRTDEDKHYCKVHGWINIIYGKADHCNNINCDGYSTTYNWAKIRNKEHDYKVENYTQLCMKCHKIYDLNVISIINIKPEYFVPIDCSRQMNELQTIFFEKIKMTKKTYKHIKVKRLLKTYF